MGAEPDWHAMAAIAIAYAGDVERAAAVLPALERLRRAVPGARLVLLWPRGLAAPAAVARRATARVSYPLPSGTVTSERARLAVATAAAAVRASGAAGALVLTATGHAPDGPAYLAYLAGIGRRAAFATEFGGAVLTDAVPPPAAASEEQRHLALLDALGLDARGASSSVHASSEAR